MGAGILQAIDALLDQIEQQFPSRWPELGSLPPTVRDRLHRSLAAAAERLLRARLAATRTEPLSDEEIALVVQAVRLELSGLELDLRLQVDRSRWQWLAGLVEAQVIPWLQQLAQAAIAAVVAAIEARYRERSQS